MAGARQHLVVLVTALIDDFAWHQPNSLNLIQFLPLMTLSDPKKSPYSTRVIIAGFSVVVMLMIIMATVTMLRIDRIQSLVAEITHHYAKHVQLAHRMYHAARERSYVLVKLVHAEDLFERDAYALRFWALGHEVAQARQDLMQRDLDAEGRAMLEQQARATGKTVPIQEQVIDLAMANQGYAAMKLLTDYALPEQEQVLSALTAFIELENRKIELASRQAGDQVLNSKRLLMVTTLLIVLATLLIGYFVYSNMSGLMRGLANKTEQLRASVRELNFQKQALDEHAIVSIADPQGRITYVNDLFCAVSQYDRAELLGQDHRIVNSQRHPKGFFNDLWRTIASGRVWQGEVCNRRKDGSYYWVNTTILPIMDEAGQLERYVSVRTDISAIKQAEALLESNQERLEKLVEQRTAALAEREASFQRLSETDMLTGVANRRKFDEILQIEASRAQRHGLPLSLVMIDIDHFKSLNDSYGHQTGDAVLVEFARLISGSIRAHDLFARWGGEEFTLLAPLCDNDNTCQLANKLRQLVADHVFTDVGQVTASFGVATYQPDEAVDDLLSRADQALYAAKSGGRNRVEVRLG